MNSKTPTTKALRLRLQAARMAERALPEQVRRAYGEAPGQLADLPADDPLLAETRERARTTLVERGLLTREELDTLPVAEATAAALGVLRDQIAALQEEQAEHPTRPDPFGPAPRTLRR